MIQPLFIHLRVHSDYSIRYGLAKPKDLVKKIAELNMPSMALTDFSNFFGLLKFYISAHNTGIKPIIGSKFNLINNLMDNDLNQIIALASNNQGYKNLTLLMSRSYQCGYGLEGPTILKEWLAEFAEGLILLSGGRLGDIGKNLLRGNSTLVLQHLNFYRKYFPERYYLELIRTGRQDEENYLQAAVALSNTENIPVVATNDVCFIHASDFDAHEIRVAIHEGCILNNSKRLIKYSPQQYLRSEQEMCSLFKDLPSALENSVEIAKRCNVTLTLGKYFLPQFSTGAVNIKDYLIKHARKGLEKRLELWFTNKNSLEKNRIVYEDRLQRELQIINQMGFPGYFLIVMEFIQWAKQNGVPVGPGRGSGAGSLVAYALNITDLDPIRFNLIFERFLNPQRISLPDFDIDFCMEKRDQVIDHVTETYGRDAVSQIITFGTMTAKSVIRDVGRVLDYSYSFVDRIAKLIPSNIGITLNQALNKVPKLAEIYNSNEEVKVLIDMAQRLEGVIRNASKHAGGVVIAPTKITDFAPLYCDEKGNHPVTQFDKNDVEYVGLVKFDFLGLKTLTIINWTLEMINLRCHQQGKPPLDITRIPLDDSKSFSMLQQAETTAIFQLESMGIKKLIRKLRPDCFEDIIALIALFRPGPLQSGMVANFINRKHGKEKISYPDSNWQHSLLKPVLEPTYGIILYQEQVMQIAQILAGYTLGEADILRRAMGKKNLEDMIQQRSVFRLGAEKKGIDSKLAMKIFDLLEKFAGYGFNKSHSAAYALLSYQTLWLKTHYPAQFLAAAMSADLDNQEKIITLLEVSKHLGIKILPPNINTGRYKFYVNDDNKIVYGLGAIKGIGKAQIETILNIRQKGGNFIDIFDFCARTKMKKIHRKVIEKLIFSGACDALGPHRAAMIEVLEEALRVANQSKETYNGQRELLGIISEKSKRLEQLYAITTPWQPLVILAKERETLGWYLTGHPINQYLKEIKHYTSSGMRIKDIKFYKIGQIIQIAGLVVNTRIVRTKNGQREIGICRLDDDTCYIDVILLNNIFERYKNLLEINKIIIVTGKVNIDNFSNNFQIIANKLIDINEVRTKLVRSIAITLTTKHISTQLLRKLHNCLEQYNSGLIPVHIYYQNEVAQVMLESRSEIHWRISLNDSLLNDLRALLGPEYVNLEFD
ncbi:MAG: DNA polymerase III subunit alpha [Candidatus Dasytiphilus stammeri]